jgi:diamine N-acetyltransferase
MKRTIQPFGDDVISLRLIEERDLESTLKWRNNDAARVWFKSSEIIQLDQHRAWFNHYRYKSDDFLFIVEAEGSAVGQASVYAINWETRSAEVGRFLIAPNQSGKGYIRKTCGLLVDFCTENLGLNHLYLDVFETNSRAINIYENAGFSITSRIKNILRMERHSNQ